MTMYGQISRATYLDIIMHEQVTIDTITDSLEREAQQNALMDEKMEFFAAVERGKLVLGDTLLHIAVRLGHEGVVDFLLLTDHTQPHSSGSRITTASVPKTLQTAGAAPTSRSKPGTPAPHPDGGLAAAPVGALNTTQTPNFKGELPKDVVGTNRFLRLFLENVADVHDVFGFEYRDEPRVHRLVTSLRRIWPLWMFDGQQEVASLVRVLYSARSSDPAFGNLVKVAGAASDRFRRTLSLDGVQLALRLVRKHDNDFHAARQALATDWTSDEKRRVLFETLFRRWFRAWKWRRHDERDRMYADLFDTAMDAWLQIVQDLHLDHSDSADTNMIVASAVDAAVLKRYELQIWKRRVRPPVALTDDLCTHITALEAYLDLAHLQV